MGFGGDGVRALGDLGTYGGVYARYPGEPPVGLDLGEYHTPLFLASLTTLFARFHRIPASDRYRLASPTFSGG